MLLVGFMVGCSHYSGGIFDVAEVFTDAKKIDSGRRGGNSYFEVWSVPQSRLNLDNELRKSLSSDWVLSEYVEPDFFAIEEFAQVFSVISSESVRIENEKSSPSLTIVVHKFNIESDRGYESILIIEYPESEEDMLSRISMFVPELEDIESFSRLSLAEKINAATLVLYVEPIAHEVSPSIGISRILKIDQAVENAYSANDLVEVLEDDDFIYVAEGAIVLYIGNSLQRVETYYIYDGIILDEAVDEFFKRFESKHEEVRHKDIGNS
jgi:hypothetical protein